MDQDEKAIALLRNHLQTLLQNQIPDLIINGDPNHRLSGNLHISFKQVPNTAIIARTRHKLAISTGSACSSGTITPSHVLQAIGLPPTYREGSLRISIGKYNTLSQIEQAADIIITAYQAILKLL